MSIKNSLSSGWITANQRLALYFQQQHDQIQQATGKQVWETLDCLSLKGWVLRVYAWLNDATRFVLTEQQELMLWESVIAHAIETQAEFLSLSAHALAKTAQAAWRLMKESETSLHLLSASDAVDVKAFYQWAQLFEQQCHEKKCIDFSSCIDSVIAAIAAKKIALPNQITVAGFEEVSAQTKRLFSVLASQTQVTHHPVERSSTHSIQKIGLDNEELELQLMAKWAYQMQWENPQQLIGCVVPDLNDKRHIVERVFNRVFNQSARFNISGGVPLSHFPVIKTAFDILTLDPLALDMTVLSRLLNTAFLSGAEQELISRANLHIKLLETLEPQLSWQTMWQMTKKQENCSIWLQQCEQYKAHYDNAPDHQDAYGWGNYFAEQLQCMGWPGERTTNSAEYQQIQRWYLLLQEFASLDAVLQQPLSRSQALRHLHHLAQGTVFQPQTVKTSVQVLGLLEAVGLPFDGLWVSGMTQKNWPKGATPNPFIPTKLQRERNMPHASAERELAYSRVLTQHFSHSAATVIFSYALQEKDEPQTSSTLLADIPDISQIELQQRWHITLTQKTTIMPQALEYIEDEYAPIFQSTEILQGGASVFRHQAACPFRAFARLRLGAMGMPLSAFSMTPQERGVCLHAILEQVWQILKDHQTLCQYDQQALAKLLKPIIIQELEKIRIKRAFTLKPRFMALEQQRLMQQVLAWLALEKQRPPFCVVALESEQKVQFAGLSLKLRVDRKDQLQDGTHLVIDYKTGACSPADWFGERPFDPQLPLYGVTCDHSVGGLAFAQLTADKLQFVGLSEDDCDIFGVQAISQQKLDKSLYTWDAFLAATEVTLARLATEFQAGQATVDPKQPEQTCRYCDLQPLCRIGDCAG